MIKRSRKRSFLRSRPMRWALILFAALIVCAAAFWMTLLYLAGDREARLDSFVGPPLPPDWNRSVPAEYQFKVFTLNMAHGRQNGRNQMFQGTQRIRSHLDDIAAVIKREVPDVVALQEADASAIWSGRMNQVDYVAEKAGFTYSVYGKHVNGKRLSYGTAILSQYPMSNSRSFTFRPSPPTFSKGMVVSTVRPPEAPGCSFDVVSVHLDFSRKSVRRKQVAEIVERLKDRKRPLIIMGDFNCEWTDREATIRTLAGKLDLKAYQPENAEPAMITFPKLRKRLDWILISSDLEFVSYKVLSNIISDHFAVLCTIRQKDASDPVRSRQPLIRKP